MKKILSLTLVLAMVMSMGITTAFAAGNWEGGTQVTYTATGSEEWTVTVPATLTPGNAGDVTAAGTWGSNRKLVVSADENVVLENSINSADTKTLAVTFPGIGLVGSNTAAVTDTKAVSVANIENALFGTWSGTFYYDVEMVNVLGQFSIWDSGCANSYVTLNVKFEKGATWREFVNSEYNTAENTGIQNPDVSHGQDAIFSIVTGDDGLEHVAYGGFVINDITPDDVIEDSMTVGFICE